MKRRILVGMSGGIDSTAVCHILINQGYDVVGLTIRNVDIPSKMRIDADGETMPGYIIEAGSLAQRLNIEHYVADERDSFERDVVTPFLNGYLAGVTPNPCVECNPRFKFNVLVEWADKLGCEYIATGHYARIVSLNGSFYVARGVDDLKDQSYFLWRLGQDVLKRTIFPLGEKTKSEVRRYLADNGFEMKSHDTESMEICFIEKDYRDLLKTRIPDIDNRIGSGKFVDAEGKVIGTHKGYPFYTIGQRKGLVVAFGKPVYVLRTNAEKNTVMLGQPEQLETSSMFVQSQRFVGISDGNLPSEEGLSVRIRYRSRAIPCSLEIIPGEERLMVRFLEQASAVTPGQSAVFYCGDTVIGGAIISTQRGINQYINTDEIHNTI
jgi:tRNA-uridine 2-sulfurtransferase